MTREEYETLLDEIAWAWRNASTWGARKRAGMRELERLLRPRIERMRAGRAASTRPSGAEQED